MGVPQKWMVCKGDDDWGYPHFGKPPYHPISLPSPMPSVAGDRDSGSESGTVEKRGEKTKRTGEFLDEYDDTT